MNTPCVQIEKLSLLDKTLSLNEQSLIQMKEDINEVKIDMKEIKEKIGNFATKEDIKTLFEKKADKEEVTKEIDNKFNNLLSKILIWIVSIAGATWIGISVTNYFSK